jgi:hypothetical protein
VQQPWKYWGSWGSWESNDTFSLIAVQWFEVSENMISGDKTQCRGGFRDKINGATNHLSTKPALPQSFT